MSVYSIGIIGAGKLGSALAASALKIGALDWIISKKSDWLNKRNLILSKNQILNSIDSIANLPDIIFIAVQDTKIETAVSELAIKIGKLKIDKSPVVLHLSGAINANIFEKFGLEPISAHPFQTFYNLQDNLFENIAWGIDSKREVPELEWFIASTKGKAIYLSSQTLENKPLYHISAVFASNYLNASIYCAIKAAKLAGINPKDFLPKLIETSIENAISAIETEELPLTGPIARKDSLALARHISALKTFPELKDAYNKFGSILIQAALDYKIIDANDAEQLLSELK